MTRLLLPLAFCLTLSSCAIVNSPIRVTEQLAKSSIRTAERAAGLAIEILDEPFEDD